MSAEDLSPTAIRRIQQELKEWMKSPGADGFLLEHFEPIGLWKILMKGPESGSRLYSDELFTLQVKFSKNYPMDPPEVIFLPEAPVHPHVYSNGHICLDILYAGRNGSWSPALTINKICFSLLSMLASNTEKIRPPGDQDYVNRVKDRSPKLTRWDFHDDKC